MTSLFKGRIIRHILRALINVTVRHYPSRPSFNFNLEMKTFAQEFVFPFLISCVANWLNSEWLNPTVKSKHRSFNGLVRYVPRRGQTTPKCFMKAERSAYLLLLYCDQVDLPILLFVSSAVVLVISEALR